MPSYVACNAFLIVKPIVSTSNIIVTDATPEYENPAAVGIRDKSNAGAIILLSEAIKLEIISSPFRDIAVGTIVYVRNSAIQRMATDKTNYYIDEKDILLLEDKPYKDNVLCRDIQAESTGIIVENQNAILTNALVYDSGNCKEVKSKDTIVYKDSKKTPITLDGVPLFIIDRQYIVCTVK